MFFCATRTNIASLRSGRIRGLIICIRRHRPSPRISLALTGRGSGISRRACGFEEHFDMHIDCRPHENLRLQTPVPSPSRNGRGGYRKGSQFGQADRPCSGKSHLQSPSYVYRTSCISKLLRNSLKFSEVENAGEESLHCLETLPRAIDQEGKAECISMKKTQKNTKLQSDPDRP